MVDGTSSAVDSWHLEAAPAGPSPRAAFSKLLRGRGYGDATAVGLASYFGDLVSLPGSVHGCPLVHSLVSGELRVALEEYQERTLRPPGDPALADFASEYTDPLMRYNRKENRHFASRLLAVGRASLALGSRERSAYSS